VIKKIISIIFQISILLLVVMLPIFKFNFDASIILSAVALLFTILIGFFIAAATSNYLRLQTIISNEDAILISIFDLVKILQPSSEKKFRKLIDEYMIAALDYSLLDYFETTSAELDGFLVAIDKVKPVDQRADSLLQNLQNLKSNIVAIRQEALVLAKRIVTAQHWFVLISLVSIMTVILLGLRTEDVFGSLLIGVIIIALYQTLNLLYKIDSNEFLADRLAYEAPQKVFLAIGKTKYYPETAIDNKKRKILGKENYRIGIYKDFSKSMEKKIRLIKAAS